MDTSSTVRPSDIASPAAAGMELPQSAMMERDTAVASPSHMEHFTVEGAIVLVIGSHSSV